MEGEGMNTHSILLLTEQRLGTAVTNARALAEDHQFSTDFEDVSKGEIADERVLGAEQQNNK